jgi:glycerol-3-phosphate dehydrogenase
VTPRPGACNVEGVTGTAGPTWRSAAFDALEREAFDLLVVGGGINGAGIARDAVLRGLRVAVVEQADFASGTSSRSSKLIHGGIRYLEQGHVGLVLEATRERERLRRLAPHLVRPMRFVYPVYRRSATPGFWKLTAGLWAYDLLAGFLRAKRHRMLSRRALRVAEPALRADGLRGGGEYWDAWTDDARLVLETLLDARAQGAVAASYARVVRFVRDGDRLAGAEVADLLGDRAVRVRARCVVNATGPWVDAVARLDDPAAPTRLRPTKGVHLVVPRARIGHHAAIVLHAVQDGRVLFVIPWGEHSLVGTTDTDHEPGRPPRVEPSDVAYLLDTVNHWFPAARLVPADVRSAFAGLRPLVAPAALADPSDVSREEAIFVSGSGLVSIAGGKLTTYRLIAAKVVDRVAERLGRTAAGGPIGPSQTADRPLPGGTSAPERLAAEALARDGHGLGGPVVGHLAARYGERLAEVLGLVGRNRALGAPMLAGLPDPRAEVVEAVEHELALTLEDVLRRRTQVALFDAAGAERAAVDVAALMAPILGWDAEGAQTAAAEYVAAVREDRARWR